MIETGKLLGYLPNEGVAEIMTDKSSVVLLLNVSGEVLANMQERPDCYVHLINRMVIATIEKRKIVGLRLTLRP